MSLAAARPVASALIAQLTEQLSQLSLESSIKDAESSQRGYIITGIHCVEKCNLKRQRGSSTSEFSLILTLVHASGYMSGCFSPRSPDRGNAVAISGLPTLWRAC